MENEEVIQGEQVIVPKTIEEILKENKEKLINELNILNQLKQKNLEEASSISIQIERHIGALSLIKNLEKI